MKKIAIIGAGIAGLSAGIYARKNGYDATIFESHNLPGGMCTSWRRKGFTFEGCLHYVKLVGSAPAHIFYRMWKELGVVPDTKMIHHDVFHTFRDASGRTLNIYTDADKLEAELLTLSPQDGKEIRAFCKGVKHSSWFIRTTGGNPFLLAAKAAGIIGGISHLKKYGSMDLAEYTSRFNDPLIRFAFSGLFVYPDFAYAQLCFYLAGLHLRATAYPEGSSLTLARRVERTFLESNGKIEYRKKVRRIEVKDDRAIGIELDDGRVEKADIVISACDGHSTLYEMLGGTYTTPDQRDRYATQPLYSSFIQVSLGVNRDMSDTPHAVKVQTKASFEVAGKIRRELWYQHFAFDPASAPPCKTSVTVLYPSDYAWWEKLDYSGEVYKTEKRKILDITVEQLERELPGISSQIEVSDVSTPHTTFRYTGNWKAALGFIMTKNLAAEMTMKPQYALPGLDNFYMIGQWVKGFGVPMAAASGKEVIRKICKSEGKRFRAE